MLINKISILLLLFICPLIAETEHPSLFLKKGKLFVTEEMNDKINPKLIEARSGSLAKVNNGVLTVTNPSKEATARPVLKYKKTPEEFICHMRVKFDGKDFSVKKPWLDIGGQHRNHFEFNAEKVFFNTGKVKMAQRKTEIRSKAMLPLNEWLNVTIEIKSGKLALDINGIQQVYTDKNIHIGSSPAIGIKAIHDGQLHIDYIRIWEVKK